MCSQTVGLVAAECERQGITTVAIQLLKVVAEAVRPPRALWVPYPHGYPLGAPCDAGLQATVLRAMLALAEEPGPGPILKDFTPPA
jgi:hypothetical protein